MKQVPDNETASPLSGGGSRGNSRRDFIRQISGWSAGIPLRSLAPGALLASIAAAQSYRSSTDTEDKLIYVSATRLAEMIRKGEISSREAVQACFDRIDEVNPKINAVVEECRDRAFAEADALDRDRLRGEVKGALHGVPMTIKDSFDTEGVISTGGTLGRRNFIPEKDATVVARLRAAGAVLIGKSNTPEFTLGGGGRGTLNLIHGTTRNPYNLDYQPAGSSGGAGAIIAAGGAYFDIGTDYGGSIRGPAHACGITGIKPTTGVAPRTGHIVDYGGPFDLYQQPGPMARKVEDLITILPIIAGPDDNDLNTWPVPLGSVEAVDISKLRVAFYKTNGEFDPIPEIQKGVSDFADILRAAGARVTEDMPPKMRELGAIRGALSSADGRSFMRRLVAKHGTKVTSPGLNLQGEVVPSDVFTRLQEEMDAIRSEMLSWVEQYDIVICPVNAFTARPLDAERAPPGSSYNGVYNTTGWPGAVIPGGFAENGLPFGIQIVGQPFGDMTVLATAHYLESKTRGFVAPKL